MLWNSLSKAFEQFRRWSAFKTLLELVGIWKWIALGFSVIAGFWLGAFSKLDPAWKALIVVSLIALLLTIATFIAALMKVMKPEPVSEGEGEPSQKDSPLVKPKIHQIVAVGILVALALVGAVYGPKYSAAPEGQSAPEPRKDVPPPVSPSSTAAPVTAAPTESAAKPQKIPAPPKKAPPETPTQAKGSAPSPSSAGSTTTGPINTGPCSVVQVGGTGNQATGGNCGPPSLKITDEQVKQLAAQLSPFPGHALKLVLNKETEETSLFGNALMKAFTQAKIETAEIVHMTVYGPVPPGISLILSRKNPDLDFVSGLIDALAKTGLVKPPVPAEYGNNDALILYVTPLNQ